MRSVRLLRKISVYYVTDGKLGRLFHLPRRFFFFYCPDFGKTVKYAVVVTSAHKFCHEGTIKMRHLFLGILVLCLVSATNVVSSQEKSNTFSISILSSEEMDDEEMQRQFYADIGITEAELIQFAINLDGAAGPIVSTQLFQYNVQHRRTGECIW